MICAGQALITSLFGWMGWLVVIYAMAMGLDYDGDDRGGQGTRMAVFGCKRGSGTRPAAL